MEANHIAAPGTENESRAPSQADIQALHCSAFSGTVLLLLFGLIYTLPFINSLEFLRHTEADRTLIAWDMVRHNRYLTPHLIGDLYLTKPPLFYWLLAAVFTVVGEPSEWAARLVSAFSATGVAVSIYLFAIAAGARSNFSLFAALIAITTIQIFSYATKAEIDMCYAFLSCCALFSGYLSLHQRKPTTYAIAAGTFLALAFLTKGPPVILFYLSGIAGFPLLTRLQQRLPTRFSTSPSWLRQQLLVGVVFLCIVGSWLVLLTQEVGWSMVYQEFEIEILQRFSGEGITYRSGKGWYYYILKVPLALLPWTPLLIGYACLLRSTRKTSASLTGSLQTTEWNLILFSLCVSLPSLICMSMSAGKSGRYVLPLFPFLALLLAGGGFLLDGKTLRRRLNLLTLILLLVVTTACLTWPLYALESVSISLYLLTATPLLLLTVIALYRWRSSAGLFSKTFAAFLIVAIVSLSRLPESLLLAPLQNSRKSARPALKEINWLLPREATIYFLESFERWIPYYLMREQREVLRLTPELVQQWQDLERPTQRAFLILNVEDEQWRLAQIFPHDPTLEIVRTFTSGKHHFLLLNIADSKAHHFQPQKRFPTDLSTPYGIDWLTKKSPYF